MTEYAITYTNGDTETFEAARIEWDPTDTDRHYRATGPAGELLLIAHFHNVRSIRRLTPHTPQA
ncbi:hypothetical protein ACFRFJ_16005 [Streptomyces hydrogenans]|uniref:hypothetical protein n=1 Tax=Streptomyces hydrogenans TaxID=1873719 RepID=UPI0036C82D27